jgi:polyferredoxin
VARPLIGRWKVAYARRLSQGFFLALFLFLLFRTEIRGAVGAGESIGMRVPVRFFFLLDPLVGLSNALASRALYHGLGLCLLILLPTMVLGRFFCGWICPMGTLNHIISRVRSGAKRGRRAIEANRYKSWQATKYIILAVVLVAALFGTGLVGWVDPFSLLVRGMGLSVLPAANYGVSSLLVAMEHSHVPGVQSAGSLLHTALGATVLNLKQPHFVAGVVLGVVLILLLALNLRVTRFWCRALCPLGALLGVASRWSIFGLTKDADACNQCNRCLLNCQGGDDPIGGVPWHKAECHMCMNCVDACPHRSLKFRFFRRQQVVEGTNLKRRQALVGIAAGVAVVPLLRADTALGKSRNERLIRPPGALEETDFLARCIRCGECMKVCPNNSLQPAVTQAGLEGVWTPVLTPRIGYCEPSCVLCSEVCPTGAIWQITPREKGWVVGVGAPAEGAHGAARPAALVRNNAADPPARRTAENRLPQPATGPVRLGTAFYDRGRCLPWAMATDCIVCEEWCPVSPKAIYVVEAEVVDSAGRTRMLKQPRVDPSRCVGCGACEYACPLQEKPAVYVTSIGESRSPSSQILLGR